MKTKLKISYEWAGSPVQPLYPPWLGIQSQWTTWAQLVDYVAVLVRSLLPPASWILFPTVPQNSPSTSGCVTVVLCICFHPMLEEAYQETVILGSHLQAIYSVSDWLSKWDISQVGYSFHLCSVLIPINLKGKTTLRLNSLWVGWCSLLFTRRLA